ncbi:MAG TPA: dTMP kinase [Actinomycetota bacterium]|nr:dTMP kinase [Actinomycetota bacterium]
MKIHQPEAADLHASEAEAGQVSYLSLLRNGNFFRFFLAQFVSSLGDWIGVVALVVLASDIGGSIGVGAVMTARVLPGFFVGPIAGVFADRFDRKKTMVLSDLARAAVILSLPFVENLLYLLVASAVLESLTLIWGPAKDASLPHFVKPGELTHANSLSLIAVYAPFPLGSVVFAFMATLAAFLADQWAVFNGLQSRPEALALGVDSLTFLFSALMISSLTIPTTRTRIEHLDLRQVKRDLVEGLKFVFEHKQVRPWLLGIAFTFTAAGAVFSLGVEFVDQVLGGGDRGFAFLVGFLATGMIIGLLAVSLIARRIQKDVLFSSSILLLGAGLIGLASVGSLNAAIPMASALGFFGGAAYSTGYALMHETTADELRGRTFSAAYTVIRIGTLMGLGIFPFIAGFLGHYRVTSAFGTLDLPGSRITLWLAGGVAAIGGIVSMRAIRAREEHVPAQEAEPSKRGYFVVFEGGDGSGKSTQMSALVRWLEARGADVVTTREPGGTAIGRRVRDLLLDPEARAMDPRTEALLYAADRAQHVAEVIRPALDAGKIVVSDRFIDSSLAYQGVARDLGLEEVYRISRWATDDLMPDVVFFLSMDPRLGLRRVDGDPDRIELEDSSFHDRVGDAYLELARRYPDRFVVLDANRPQAEVHQDVVEAFEARTSTEDAARLAGFLRDGGFPQR